MIKLSKEKTLKQVRHEQDHNLQLGLLGLG
jgi:hypothetical protein